MPCFRSVPFQVRLSDEDAENLNVGDIFSHRGHEGETLKVVSIDVFTNTAIVRELTPWEEICYDESELNVAPAAKSMEVRVQNGVMFKREEGNTYTPLTLTDGQYLVLPYDRAALAERRPEQSA